MKVKGKVVHAINCLPSQEYAWGLKQVTYLHAPNIVVDWLRENKGKFVAGSSLSPETSVHTSSTRRHMPQDGFLHSHRCQNLKSYIYLADSHSIQNTRKNYFPQRLIASGFSVVSQVEIHKAGTLVFEPSHFG
jgi:hypothetical protein